MSQLNISVLVAARDEYMLQLKRYLYPLIQEGFVSLWEDAVVEDDTNVLKQFQIFLKQVPKWNQTILDQESKRITNSLPFLTDLITAIFVSYVKILGSVRLGGNHRNIKIRIPSSELFIHCIYVNSAECFYYEPELFEDILNRQNAEKIKDIIEDKIEETISSMIPIQNILQEYLSGTFTNHTMSDEISNHNNTSTNIVEPSSPIKTNTDTSPLFDDSKSETSSIGDLFNVEPKNEIKEVSLDPLGSSLSTTNNNSSFGNTPSDVLKNSTDLFNTDTSSSNTKSESGSILDNLFSTPSSSEKEPSKPEDTFSLDNLFGSSTTTSSSSEKKSNADDHSFKTNNEGGVDLFSNDSSNDLTPSSPPSTTPPPSTDTANDKVPDPTNDLNFFDDNSNAAIL